MPILTQTLMLLLNVKICVPFGPDFTLKDFQQYATLFFKECYFQEKDINVWLVLVLVVYESIFLEANFCCIDFMKVYYGKKFCWLILSFMYEFFGCTNNIPINISSKGINNTIIGINNYNIGIKNSDMQLSQLWIGVILTNHSSICINHKCFNC